MPRYKRIPDAPPEEFWVVNPEGRIICVDAGNGCLDFAEAGNEGWRMASESQIKDAKKQMEADRKRGAEVSAKRSAAKETAKALAAAARDIKSGGYEE